MPLVHVCGMPLAHMQCPWYILYRVPLIHSKCLCYIQNASGTYHTEWASAFRMRLIQCLWYILHASGTVHTNASGTCGMPLIHTECHWYIRDASDIYRMPLVSTYRNSLPYTDCPCILNARWMMIFHPYGENHPSTDVFGQKWKMEFPPDFVMLFQLCRWLFDRVYCVCSILASL